MNINYVSKEALNVMSLCLKTVFGNIAVYKLYPQPEILNLEILESVYEKIRSF